MQTTTIPTCQKVQVLHIATARTPIVHGADTKEGNNQMFRKESVLLPKKIMYSTRFTEQQQKERLMALGLWLCRINEHIDYRLGIYDEFVSQLRVCSAKRNKYEAMSVFCDRFGVRNCVSNFNHRFDAMSILELFDDAELQYYFAHYSQPIVAYFQLIKDSAYKANKNTKKDIEKDAILGENAELATEKSLDVVVQDLLTKIKEQPFIKQYRSAKYDIPFISGNSIRGVCRRLMAVDFCEQIDTKLSPTLYNVLFTGGALTDSGGDENIEFRTQAIEHIPMLGLLGTAIGNAMIRGAAMITDMSIICEELTSNDADVSFFDLLQMRFQTRSDSSKQEQTFIVEECKELFGDLVKAEKAASTQMFYIFESLIRGSQFKHKFACESHNPIVISAFWRMLELFAAKPYIGAKKSLGLGELDLSQLEAQIPTDGSKKYLHFLQNKKDEIKAFIQKISEPKAKSKAKK